MVVFGLEWLSTGCRFDSERGIDFHPTLLFGLYLNVCV